MTDTPDSYRLAVRTFTEFVARRGDIHVRYDASTEGAEGIDVQRRLQQSRPDTYEREVRLTHQVQASGFSVKLSGRADGIDRSADVPLVEEIKTTRTDVPELYAAVGHLHLAQARCYAAMLALELADCASVRLRLTYAHPDTLAVTTYDTVESRAELLDFLESSCAELVDWLAAERLHRSTRDAALRDASFPFAEFRAHQRRLATAVFRSVRDGQALLAEAPTGCGKTLATVFPALKAIGEGHQQRLIFVTSRTTGQGAAEQALGQIHAQARFRQVTITAKHRICFQPEPVCDPALCQYARGYYDRRGAAIRKLLDGPPMNRERIELVARQHTVCPFELSLDAASWSDAIIGDYNYVFDPVVRLARIRGLFGDPSVLLVDEAHQLADRVRAMLSAGLARRQLRQVQGAPLAGPVAKAIRGLDRRLLALRREAQSAPGSAGRWFECAIELPERFIRATVGVCEAIREHADTDTGLSDAGLTDTGPSGTGLSDLSFALWGLARAAEWYDPDRFTTILRSAGAQITVEIVCLDPSAHIAERLGDYPASARFSATLSPHDVFQRVHGVPDAPALALPSPFPAEHLDVSIVPDVSVYYRDREQTLEALVTLVADFIHPRAGNYLIALPSFTYLDRLVQRFRDRHPNHEVQTQAPDMDAAARDAFIDRFTTGEPVTAFVVMGGVFTESVDLPGEALIGVLVVGVALPPRTLERDRMADAYGSDGFTVAYQQPAMTRVVQTAGRLIRSDRDRGALCLVDRRFLEPGYQRFLPGHWHYQAIPARALADHLTRFWRNDARPPHEADSLAG